MKYITLTLGALETNCYLVYCEQKLECAIVDPGAESEKIFRVVKQKSLRPVFLINTHGHIDHIGANKDIKDEFDIPLLIHSSDSPMLNSSLQSEIGFFIGAKESPSPDRFVKGEDEINIGNGSLKVIHTPGHSPGSVCLLGDGFLITGDLLFCGGVGRTDLPGGSWEDLLTSIKEKIFILPEDLVVLPGHGPQTTIKQEKNSNPFVR